MCANGKDPNEEEKREDLMNGECTRMSAKNKHSSFMELIFNLRLLAFISGSVFLSVRKKQENFVTANEHEWARIRILWSPMNLFPIGVHLRSLAVQSFCRCGKSRRIL